MTNNAPASKDFWLQAARDLVPVLRERVAKTEELRRVPDETIRDFRDAGLFRVLQPRRVNGAELEFGALVEIAAELARGCASSAWVLANLASHSWMLGMWSPAAQDEIWVRNSVDTLISASLVFPAGHAVAVEGGYRLHGRWGFASGIDACDWVMLGAIVEGDEDAFADGHGEYRMFLLPRSDYAVDDTWFVAGLAGTGSKEVRVDDVIVPEHRTLSLHAAQGGDTPGSRVNPGPLYRIPLLATFGYVVAGVPLGIAESAVDQFTGENRHRLASYSGRALVDFSSVQVKIAEASADVDAARRTLLANCEQIMRLAAVPGAPTLEEKARLRRDSAFATRLATRAVDLLFEASGGAALYLAHPVQRAFRDMHAAASHIAVNWDAAASIFGRVALGRTGDMPPYER